MFHCSLCLYETRFCSRLLNHYNVEHSHMPNFKVVCGINNCIKSYKNIRSFRGHLFSKHREIVKSNNSEELQISNSEEMQAISIYGDSNDLEECEDMDNNHSTEMNQHSEITKFVLSLRQKHGISDTCSEMIIEKFGNVIDSCVSKISVVLDKDFDINNISESDKILKPLMNLKKNLNDNSTAYKQQQLFKKIGYVEPLEIKLSDCDTFMYVPILTSLKELLQHHDILSYIFNPEQGCSGYISDFSSADRCQSSNYLSNKHCLRIILYIDDFQTVNPLSNSSSTRRNKICGIYWVLGNIPTMFRSKLHTIQIACLALSKNVKKYGMNAILENLITDLKKLEAGMVFEVGENQYTFHGTVSMVLGDNLAAHEIGGYIQSFSTLRICKFCNATKRSIGESFNDAYFTRRTKEFYDEAVDIVSSNESMAATYGIKTKSPLNQLRHYHVNWGLPSDVAHDLYEGFCLDLLKSIIHHGLNEKFFTLDFFNSRVEAFSYAGSDKRNKPAQIFRDGSGNITIKQTAAQCKCLVTLLSYFIGDKMPETDQHWLNYVDFLEVLEFLNAAQLNKGQIKEMEICITEFLEVFFSINPELKPKPKAHYLIHYAAQYREFGPILHQSTLRFESKHSQLKSIMRRSKNFRNTCKTIVNKHQYMQCLYHMNDNFLMFDEKSFSKIISKNLDELPLPVQTYLSLLNYSESTINLAESVIYRSFIYRKNAVVVTNFTEEIELARIQYVVQVNGDLHLILLPLEIQNFDSHYHAYIVKQLSTYLMISVQNLFLPTPIQLYKLPDTEILSVMIRHFIHPT